MYNYVGERNAEKITKLAARKKKQRDDQIELWQESNSILGR